MCESCVWFVVAEVFVALPLGTCDPVRKEMRCVDGVFLWVARSELEDEFKQLVRSPLFDNIGGNFVRLEENPMW